MKNNKGFTLVELMAVIVILAIIIAIAVPSSIAISRKIKENMYKTKIKMIESSAKIFGQDNPDIVGSDENCSDGGIVTIKTLVDKGYIKKDDTEKGEVLNPIDNSSLNNKTVCIYEKYNRIYAKFNEDSNGELDENVNKNDTTGPETATIEVKSYSGTDVILALAATDPESGISKYEVKYGTSADALTNSETVTTTEISTTTSVKVNPGSTIYFKLYAYNGKGKSKESNVIAKTFNTYRYYTTSKSTSTSLVATESNCVNSTCATFNYITTPYYIYYQNGKIVLDISQATMYYTTDRDKTKFITLGNVPMVDISRRLTCNSSNVGERTMGFHGSYFYDNTASFEYIGNQLFVTYACELSSNSNNNIYFTPTILNSSWDSINNPHKLFYNHSANQSFIDATLKKLRITDMNPYSSKQYSSKVNPACKVSACASYNYKYRTDTLYETLTPSDKNTSISGRTYYTTSHTYE